MYIVMVKEKFDWFPLMLPFALPIKLPSAGFSQKNKGFIGQSDRNRKQVRSLSSWNSGTKTESFAKEQMENDRT